MNQANGRNSYSLINNDEKIILLTDVNKTEVTTLEELRSRYCDELLYVKTEEIIDNRDKTEFIPFIACRVLPNGDK